MITYWLIVAHLVGDYLLQSDWMAQQKTASSWPAAAHALTYGLPFALFVSWPALLFIVGTHFVIDRWRLARYVVWAKNFLAPRWLDSGRMTTEWCGSGIPGNVPLMARNHPWADCSATGYHKDRPPWLAVWLLIIADNTMHLAMNAVAVTVWP
jgi:hypothetical protein